MISTTELYNANEAICLINKKYQKINKKLKKKKSANRSLPPDLTLLSDSKFSLQAPSEMYSERHGEFTYSVPIWGCKGLNKDGICIYKHLIALRYM